MSQFRRGGATGAPLGVRGQGREFAASHDSTDAPHLRDRTMLRGPRRPEIVAASYLGYPLLIGDADIRVFTPAGRLMCSAASVKQARALIRSYRRSAL